MIRFPFGGMSAFSKDFIMGVSWKRFLIKITGSLIVQNLCGINGDLANVTLLMKPLSSAGATLLMGPLFFPGL